MRSSRPGPGNLATAALVLVAALVVAAPVGRARSTAAGAAVDETAAVSTDPTGAHVELRRRGTWVETRSASGGATRGCLRSWVLAPGAFFLRRTPVGDYRPVPMPPAPGPEYRPYHVYCDGTYVTSAWIAPTQFGVDPRALAEEAVRDLPYPETTIGASPAGRGLTGLETWFWVTGYTGAPIADTVRELGMAVDVEAVPASVSWDFGDDSLAAADGLGSPPPARSEVAHTYERRARPVYRVRALVRLTVRWRLDGGEWQGLAPVTRTAVLEYPVVESRAALVR